MLTRTTPAIFSALRRRASLSQPLRSIAMKKSKVYVTRLIPQASLDALKEDCEVTMWPENEPVPREELLRNVADKEALFCTLSDRIDGEVLDQARSLKVVATMSVGFDHLDVDEIKRRGIRVGYTPNILTDATAELTVALLLATSRRLVEASDEAKSGGWKAWSPFWMCGPGLADSTVGIVGFGRIGQAVARRLKAFQVKSILFQNRSKRPAEAAEIGAKQVDLDSLLKESDFVVACCALTPDTRSLFNLETFAKMKRTAVFVNTSRGAIVEQEHLVQALENNLIWGAGLDVTTPEPLPLDSPLFKLKNCVILPHIGSASIETRTKMAKQTVENIVCALRGQQMPAELVL